MNWVHLVNISCKQKMQNFKKKEKLISGKTQMKSLNSLKTFPTKMNVHLQSLISKNSTHQ